jgi:hypothetical protein
MSRLILRRLVVLLILLVENSGDRILNSNNKMYWMNQYIFTLAFPWQSSIEEYTSQLSFFLIRLLANIRNKFHSAKSQDVSKKS